MAWTDRSGSGQHPTALRLTTCFRVQAGGEQFVMVTSLGTGKVGFPASVLNLFGGILSYKREAEKALESSGMAYSIVRPGARACTDACGAGGAMCGNMHSACVRVAAPPASTSQSSSTAPGM